MDRFREPTGELYRGEAPGYGRTGASIRAPPLDSCMLLLSIFVALAVRPPTLLRLLRVFAHDKTRSCVRPRDSDRSELRGLSGEVDGGVWL